MMAAAAVPAAVRSRLAVWLGRTTAAAQLTLRKAAAGMASQGSRQAETPESNWIGM
jgi:hypothetical protein